MNWEDAHMEVVSVASGLVLASLYVYEYLRPDPKIKVVRKVGQTHGRKIGELVDDSGLSTSYVKKLIGDSNNKDEYEAIYKYLSNHKQSHNLSNNERWSMIKQVKGKLDEINDREMLKKILEAVKEKGTSSVDDIMDWAGHFI